VADKCQKSDSIVVSSPAIDAGREGSIINDKLSNAANKKRITCDKVENVKVQLMTGEVKLGVQIGRCDAVEFLAAGSNRLDVPHPEVFDNDEEKLIGESEDVGSHLDMV
jgi:hypothetical protein